MFLVRADGNARIGAGHLMRCLAIAEELALLRCREEICFVCADEESGAFVSEHGFRSYILGTDPQDMESELPLWKEQKKKGFLSEEAEGKRNVLLVDSYHVTDRYLAELKQMGDTVLLDDLGTHPYPVDCVINYNAPACLETYERLYQGQKVRLLIGSRYIPLRRQFWEAAQRPPAWQTEGTPCEGDQVKTVLITTGGGDISNIAGKILWKLYREDLEFHLVVGRFSPHFQTMKDLERNYGNLRIHHDVKDMAALMQSCEIALTAGGSTIYELAAVGVPLICFSYAENQEPLTEYLGRTHVAGYAGAWHREPEETLARMRGLFEELLGSRRMREEYSLREGEMVDGRGARRLAEKLVEMSEDSLRK